MFTLDLGGGAQLRPLEPWQAAVFAEHVARSRAHLAPWVPFANRVVDVDSARQWLQRMADWQADDVGRCYGIWLDDTLVGAPCSRTSTPSRACARSACGWHPTCRVVGWSTAPSPT